MGLKEMLGQTIAPAARSVQKVNRHWGMAETAQNGLRQERKGYAGKFKAGMRGRGGCCKGASPLSRCTCASKCAFLITHPLPELKPHVCEDGHQGSNPSLRSGRKREPEQHGQQKALLILHTWEQTRLCLKLLHAIGSLGKKPWRNWEGWCSLKIPIASITRLPAGAFGASPWDPLDFGGCRPLHYSNLW